VARCSRGRDLCLLSWLLRLTANVADKKTKFIICSGRVESRWLSDLITSCSAKQEVTQLDRSSSPPLQVPCTANSQERYLLLAKHALAITIRPKMSLRRQYKTDCWPVAKQNLQLAGAKPNTG